MVKARSLFENSKEGLEGVFAKTPAGSAPLPVVQPVSMDDLKKEFRKDAIYKLPASWFDLDDKIFATRTDITQEAIDSMADAIESQGQLEPIKARLDQTKDKLQIVMGWTRTLGCAKLGRTVDVMLTDADARTCKAWALAENMVRNELTGWDQARKTIELLEEGFTVEEVSKFLGDVSKGQVYDIKRIFNYPLIVDALTKGKIGISDAIHLSKKCSSGSVPDELQSKAILAFEAGTLKRSNLDYFIDQKGVMPATAAPALPEPGGPKKIKGKGKGIDKTEKRNTTREGAETYFQRFTDGKIHFSAKAIPGKTELKELKRIQAAALQFSKAVEAMIKKAK